MSNFYKTLLSLSIIFGLNSCSKFKASPTTSKDGVVYSYKEESGSNKPDWINNPHLHPSVASGIANHKAYGIGYAREHMRGEREQRKLAISDAINQIASQKGTKVDSTLELNQQVIGNQGSVNISSYSKQTVDGQTVSANVVGAWKNEQTKELYILMVE